jgi:C_GCAxxG_C_C family probable redox protein
MLLSASEALNIQSSAFPQIATAFGAGIARSGQICGLATGSVMIIGLRFGRRKAGDESTIAYYQSQEFLKKFTALSGTYLCYEITHTDLNTEEGQLAWNDHIQKDICIPLLYQTAEILNQLLNQFGNERI